MGRNSRAEKTSRDVEHFRSTVVSCVDCGVLCEHYTGYGWKGLYDVLAYRLDDVVIPAVGVETVLRQGVGVGNGGKHRCPPTFNLVGDVMNLGAREEGGDDAC